MNKPPGHATHVAAELAGLTTENVFAGHSTHVVYALASVTVVYVPSGHYYFYSLIDVLPHGPERGALQLVSLHALQRP